MTPDERRESRRAQMRLRMADPEWQAKRIAAIRARFAKHRETGCLKEVMTERNKKIWAKRRRNGTMGYTEERRAVQAARLAKLRAETDFEQRRIAGMAKTLATPRGRLKKSLDCKRAVEARRGFKVPVRLEKEYHFLRKTKLLTAAEAGRILGLVT